MQSTTSRACSVASVVAPSEASLPPPSPSSVAGGGFCRSDSSTPSAKTETPRTGVRSSTSPPACSKRVRTRSSSAVGETPTSSTPRSCSSKRPSRGGPPKRHAIGPKLSGATSASSEASSTPTATSWRSSSSDVFQSCARPRSGPASMTATRWPCRWRAHASSSPSVPPQTATSTVATVALEAGGRAVAARGWMKRAGVFGGHSERCRRRSEASCAARLSRSDEPPAPPTSTEVGSAAKALVVNGPGRWSMRIGLRAPLAMFGVVSAQ